MDAHARAGHDASDGGSQGLRAQAHARGGGHAGHTGHAPAAGRPGERGRQAHQAAQRQGLCPPCISAYPANVCNGQSAVSCYATLARMLSISLSLCISAAITSAQSEDLHCLGRVRGTNMIYITVPCIVAWRPAQITARLHTCLSTCLFCRRWGAQSGGCGEQAQRPSPGGWAAQSRAPATQRLRRAAWQRPRGALCP